jgi:hypothetical protein
MNREQSIKRRIKFYSFDIKAEFDALEENEIKILANDPIYLSQLFVKLFCQLVLIKQVI